LGNVSWSHFIFRFFDKFCKHVLRNKLHWSKNFIIFGPMDQSYGETKNLGKVWAGQVSARANQQELTTCAQHVGRKKEGIFGKGEFKAPIKGRWMTVGR
jgi:hypothetical protein